MREMNFVGEDDIWLSFHGNLETRGLSLEKHCWTKYFIRIVIANLE